MHDACACIVRDYIYIIYTYKYIIYNIYIYIYVNFLDADGQLLLLLPFNMLHATMCNFMHALTIIQHAHYHNAIKGIYVGPW